MVALVNTCLFFFFFFQAEDGIRDKLVTGVQTCALPISRSHPAADLLDGKRRPAATGAPDGRLKGRGGRGGRQRPRAARAARSEERRVGKECRSRWSPDH